MAIIMERVAEVLRGWPYDGSLDRYEPIGTGVTLYNGDWVVKQSDGTVALSGSTNTVANSPATGLVVIGNGDSASAQATASTGNNGKAVVLWGNFVARLSGSAPTSYGTASTGQSNLASAPGLPNAGGFGYAAGSYTPGAPITSKNGVITLGTPGTDQIIGHVLDVVANATSGNYIVVRIF